MFERLLKIIKGVMPEVDVSKATPESKLVDDLHFDSIGIMMLAMGVEEEFKVTFEGDLNFVTVQDVMNYIEKNSK